MPGIQSLTSVGGSTVEVDESPGNCFWFDGAYAACSTIGTEAGVQGNNLFAKSPGDLGYISKYQDTTGFNFAALPNPAFIVGVSVTFRKHQQLGILPLFAIDRKVQLLVGGTGQGNNKASASLWPNTVQSFTYGASTDPWGLSLTRAQVVAANFGIRIQAQNVSSSDSAPYTCAYLEQGNQISMTVYYVTEAVVPNINYLPKFSIRSKGIGRIR